MDVFIGYPTFRDDSPNSPYGNDLIFAHDMHFKQVKKLALNSDNYPKFKTDGAYQVTIFVNAINEKENNLLRNSLDVSFEILVDQGAIQGLMSALSFLALI